jgi:hypothetical protein
MEVPAFARSRSNPLERCLWLGPRHGTARWVLVAARVVSGCSCGRGGATRGRVSDGDSSVAGSANSRHRDNFNGK